MSFQKRILARGTHSLIASVAVLAVTFAGVGVVTVATVLARMPSIPEVDLELASYDDLSELAERATSQSSVVLDVHGSVVGRFEPQELHASLRPEEIPETLRTAIVASEDRHFWEHKGFNLVSAVRAAVTNGRRGEVAQGGSTITQQLAKNLFTSGDRTLERKLYELGVATALEDQFTKDEILTAYLNSTFFGAQAFGAEAASQTYLRKPAAELTLGEAALLAAVVPAPTEFNPREGPESAEARRQLVLDRVAEIGAASSTEIARARSEQPLVHPPQPMIEGSPYYLDYVRTYLLDVAKVPAGRLYGGGLVIHTALDPVLQAQAEQAVLRHLPDPTGPTAALVVVEPDSGAVRAVVGGRQWGVSQVNLALGRLGGGSGRQPGSSFKPFVLATAFEQDWSPTDMVDAPETYLPTTVSDPLPVRNFARQGYGRVTLAEATVRSINTSFVALTETVGASEVASVATRLGIESLPPAGEVGPSIGVGTYEVSPLEMASAFASFAADGRRVRPSPVTALDVPEGTEPVHLPPAGAGEQAVKADSAHLVTQTLRDVITRGTATAARISRPAAAKTGTSDNHENAWLVGYTPQLAAAVWVGFESGNQAMTDVAGVARVTGGSIPSLIWRDVMTVAHRDMPVEEFPAAPDRPSRHRLLSPTPQDAVQDDQESVEPVVPVEPILVPAPQTPLPAPVVAPDVSAIVRERVCGRVPDASICRNIAE